MEQPKKKKYGKEDEEKRKKQKHLYTFKINTYIANTNINKIVSYPTLK